MIFEYGFSVVGKSHITKGTCCQDSHYIKKLENGWVIAAVADGVGSAKNSHIGSKIAAQTVVDFCEECMPWDYNMISIKSMMRTAYNYAYKLILRESEKSGEPIESYDTTLTMVIYDGQRIIYGHSGDGAIIGLTTFGDYVEITRAQKGADGVSVLPLRSGYTQWAIDSYEEDLAAVILVTDGMLETICPYLLRDHDRKVNCAYVALASFFADPSAIAEDKEDEIRDVIRKFITAEENYCVDEFYERFSAILKAHLSEGVDEILEKYKKNNYPIALMQKEQDDKTVVGLLNPELLLDSKTTDFYSEPDWNALQEAWNRKAYPHLYASEDKVASVKEKPEEMPEKVEKKPEETPEKIEEKIKKPEEAVEKPEETVRLEKLTESENNLKKSVKEQESEDSDAFDIILGEKATQRNTDSDKKAIDKLDPVIKDHIKPRNSRADSKKNAATDKNIVKPVAPPKHSKPKKKGVIGFFEDLFN